MRNGREGCRVRHRHFCRGNHKARDCLGDLVVDGGAILTWGLENRVFSEALELIQDRVQW